MSLGKVVFFIKKLTFFENEVEDVFSIRIVQY